MKYSKAVITAIRDDLIKSKIVINFEVDRDPENLEISEDLAQYAGKEPQTV
jgi:hypothetical protein